MIRVIASLLAVLNQEPEASVDTVPLFQGLCPIYKIAILIRGPLLDREKQKSTRDAPFVWTGTGVRKSLDRHVLRLVVARYLQDPACAVVCAGQGAFTPMAPQREASVCLLYVWDTWA